MLAKPLPFSEPAALAYPQFNSRFTSVRSLSVSHVPEKSIAVLPFIDLSEQTDQAYLCDGVTEQIITALTNIHGLFVVARTSAFAFKNKLRKTCCSVPVLP